MKISHTTIKQAKQQFKSKTVELAKYLLENETMAVVYGEFIDDSDNEELKQCLLFIIDRHNLQNKRKALCTHLSTLRELNLRIYSLKLFNRNGQNYYFS